MKDARASGDILLVDAGDAFGGDPADEDTRTKAELIADAMGRMGYDAVGIGETELKYGPEFLKQIQEKYGLTYLSANLKLDGKSPDFVKPYIIKEVGGKKIAVTAVVDGSILTDEKTAPELKEKYTSDNYKSALTSLVPQLRAEADVVVVLAHIGPAGAQALAKEIPGIDVIVAGHSGILMNPPIEVNDTVIVQASRKAKYVGELNLHLDSKNEIIGHTGAPVLLNPGVKDDPDMLALVNEYKSRLKNPPTPTPSTTAVE